MPALHELRTRRNHQMPKLGTKPALMLGVTAAMVMGVSGVSAQTRVTATSTASATSATTPDGKRVGGPGRGGFGANTTALAKKLGVSVADLQAAMKAVRDSDTKPDRATELASEAKTIADALGVESATVTTALEASRPAKAAQPTGTTPSSTTPPKDAPSGTTPGKGAGGPGGHRGGGPRGGADDTALIAALVKATGKDEAAVKAALTKADAVRDAARKAHQAEFAKRLAAQLKLDEAKVAAAIETSRPASPARNAKESTSQTK